MNVKKKNILERARQNDRKTSSMDNQVTIRYWEEVPPEDH